MMRLAELAGSDVKQVEIKPSVLNKRLFWLVVESPEGCQRLCDSLHGMLDEEIGGFRLINIGAS